MAYATSIDYKYSYLYFITKCWTLRHCLHENINPVYDKSTKLVRGCNNSVFVFLRLALCCGLYQYCLCGWRTVLLKNLFSELICESARTRNVIAGQTISVSETINVSEYEVTIRRFVKRYRKLYLLGSIR